MPKLLSLLGLILAACTTAVVQDHQALPTEKLVIEVQSPSDFPRVDEPVLIPLAHLGSAATEDYRFTVGGQEIPSQLIDDDSEGNLDHYLLVTNLQPGKEVSISAVKSSGNKTKYPARVQAELSVKSGGEFVDRVYQGGTFANIESLLVPPEHTDHSFFIRYEGPGWESDKVGYRFYLDWRNAIDIFGKKTSDMVLQNGGKDGFNSYHEMSDWGMDILKVGSSLGIGSIGYWYNNKAERVAVTGQVSSKIISNGPLQAGIKTIYPQWQVGDSKYDLSSVLTINAGSRITRNHLEINPVLDNLCTGIVKHADATVLSTGSSNSEWSYLATFGSQSLAGDNLGMAIIYRSEQLLDLKEDEYSHVVVLKPDNGILDYYFLAAWQGESEGIEYVDEFKNYLDKEIDKLNQQLIIGYR